MASTVREILKLQGSLSMHGPVTVRGWIRTRRDSKAGISFVQLYDGSSPLLLQIVVPNTLENYETEVLRLTAGASIEVQGEIQPSQGKGQEIEVLAQTVKVLGWVEDPATYPIQPKRHRREFLRTVAHLRPRTNLIASVTRVRHSLSQAVHRFFHERGFYWIHTPIITTNDCEGAGEMFRVSTLDLQNLPRTQDGAVDWSQDFFGKEAFLTVSGQLAVECYCLAMSKVYTFGPTFRAENSHTKRHLAEFWMVEPEVAFADLREIAQLSEDFLKYIFSAVLEERAEDMHFFAKYVDRQAIDRLDRFVRSSFVTLEYSKAVKVLEKAKQKFEFPVYWGMDLQSEHERYLSEVYAKGPVVVINYPKEIKAFYMRENEDGKTVAAMDVLAPGIGEIIGGSQREERLEILDRRIRESGLDPQAYDWYRDLRKYGTVPHSGFGLGFDRTVSYVTGVDNLRDVIPFPRTPGQAEF